jgi:hypothetical protein
MIVPSVSVSTRLLSKRYSVPPGYQRQQAVRPKLGPWLGVIDAIWKKTRHGLQNNGTPPRGSSSG